MRTRSSRWYWALGVSLSAATGVSACGGSGGSPTGAGGVSTGTAGTTSTGSHGGGNAGGAGGETSFVTSSTGVGGAAMQGFNVTPSALQTITVAVGQALPTVTYTATLDGQPANAGWGVDKGNIGTIPAGPSTVAAFTPTGTTGGVVTIQAGLNKMTVQRQILVQLTASQNGPDLTKPGEQAQVPSAPGDLKAGGGVGGVGGDGLGVAVDPTTATLLGTPSGDGKAQSLALLYPYDKTIWPRGMLAPLLMWSWTLADADAIQIKLETTTKSFSWTGTFGKPAILAQTGGKFIRHPIPQDIWDMATNTAAGKADQLTVSLTVAKDGSSFGPISQTWTVAPARLTGSVYYNSYGTQLVKNWTALDKAGHSVGAAILGVRSGDLAPKLIVGQNSPTDANGNPTNNSGCRVCHTVSSRGQFLLAQAEQGNPGNGRSFLYDLTAADVQGSAAQIAQEGVFGWAALVGDGTYALTNTINPSSTNPAILNSSNGSAKSSFWQFSAAPQAAVSVGLPNPVAAGYPSYSPDDKYLAYIDVTGQTQDVKGPLMEAAYDSATHTFSNLQTLHTPAAGQRIGYPVFLPDNSGILFETGVRSSQSDTVMVTRNGARSELWWTNLGASPQPVALETLNGKSGGASYLPVGPNNHGIAGASDPQSGYSEAGQDDTTLNYEPTVLPISAGGYAWVVFTSRRSYGNQLNAVPWQSWPPSYDTTDLSQATVKKLWVAAIDLGAPAGTDPSHPAFYLPAQEILAGNSRGFWVLDPCKADGQSCATGDQCCNGYCEPNGPNGALVCSNIPLSGMCSAPQEKCVTAADCCDATNVCINGFCATKGIN
jgi:hypothetical protein